MTITSPTSTDAAAFAREWEQWRRTHEERRADPHGFLAITGLFWLDARRAEVPGLPGVWRTGADGPVVDLAEGEFLAVDGTVVTGSHAFGPIPERSGMTVGFDGGVIEVARRGGRDILRPRRPDFPFLASYAGTPAYDPDPSWLVDARYVAYATPRPHEVGAAVDGLVHVYDAPGYLEFERDGRAHRLVAFPGYASGSLIVLFTDETSGITTYAANRSVSVDVSDAGGQTTIDFNRAVNLPCAYTDFATCPLPPAENRLPIPVEAGEQIPLARAEGIATEAGIVPAAGS